MKALKNILFLAACAAFAAMWITSPTVYPVLGAALMLVVACGFLRSPSSQLQATLSVPEILMDVMEAFRFPLYPLSMFSTDYSSKTAVKSDVIYGHIATLPTASTYDPATGFLNGVQEADALLTDIPVTLDQFSHVPIRVKYLTQLASKLPLYREATRNAGYALAKAVLDYALSKVLVANFTHGQAIAAANFTLDSLEEVRTQLNAQGASPVGRFGILNSAYAAALQNDDRVKSALFYAQLNGNQGYRVFRNIAGFEQVVEYPDLPANGENLGAFFGDKRAIVLANRQVDFANASVELAVPQIMEFIPMTDPQTGLTMTGVGWQQPGTGDVVFSAAVLYGVGAGAQAGGANAKTDKAGYRITTV